MAVLDINTNPTRRDLRWFGLLLPLFVAIVGAVVWRRTGSLTPATVVWGAGALLSAASDPRRTCHPLASNAAYGHRPLAVAAR